MVERGLQVERQLLGAAEGDQAGDRDEAAVALAQRRALPHVAEQHAVRNFRQRRQRAECALPHPL